MFRASKSVVTLFKNQFAWFSNPIVPFEGLWEEFLFILLLFSPVFNLFFFG
jgi:hypothetical protein